MEHPEIDLAQYIDHAVLQPTATPQVVQQACQAAIQYNFPTVCVYPSAVAIATEALHNQSPQVCTVIGFPTGATSSAAKCYEAQDAVENGATELDVVINLGWLKAGETDAVYQEIAQIVEATGQTVKTILETNCLTPHELRLAAEICMDAGAAYLKTSTGWFGGATIADVRRLRELTQGRVGIKASGGIRTPEQAIELILAGATRLGTSRGVELLALREQGLKA